MPSALLIGSSHGNLDVTASAEAFYTWLLGHGFADDRIRRLVGPQASRAAILAELRRLGDVEHGEEAVVVYYAGHGHLYRTEIGTDAAGFHAAHPMLVAADIDDSAGDILRSVFASELSRELRRIARRAANLTVILDCCHASGMVRLDDDVEGEDVGEQEGALHREACARIVERRLAATRDASPQLPTRPLSRLSERVVVLAASSAGGRAYPDPETGRMIFTDALLAALDRQPTWDAVLAAIRGRIHETWPNQQPAVFGPRYRRPFTLVEEPPGHDAYRVERVGERLVLMAGALHGIDADDRFDLIAFGGADDGGSPARPERVELDRTVLAGSDVSGPCYARRTRRGAAAGVSVRCADDSMRRALVAMSVAAGLRDGGSPDDVAAHLDVDGGSLRVRDCLGELVFVAPIDPLPERALLACLRRLDIWRAVTRRVHETRTEHPLARCYELRWGVARGPEILAPRGPLVIRPGERLAVSLANLDRGASELYAHVFRVRADREIEAWSAGTGAHFLAARQSLDAADLSSGTARSLRVGAPTGLPPGAYSEWTLVCVSRESFEADVMATPPAARGSSATRRGGERPRELDIVAFRYVLELGHRSANDPASRVPLFAGWPMS